MNQKARFIILSLLITVLILAACAPVTTELPTVEGAMEEATPVVEEATAMVEEATAMVEEATPVVEEAEPNIAVYAHNGVPDIDPSSSFSDDLVVTTNVYETLTFFNPPGSEEAISPKLATSWESTPDAMKWTFHLREGVKFHDGTDFNAEAVKYSIGRTMDLDLGAAYIFAPVEEVNVVDEYTVEFVLSFAAPMDLLLSSGYAAWIFSPTTVEGKDNAWFNLGNDAGTGPYTIESYEPGQSLVITRFDDYWGGWEEGQFDKVIYQFTQDPTVMEQMLRSGEADFSWSIPYENVAALADADGVRVDITPSFQNLLALINVVKPPTDDVLVRQALSYSFPYEAVAENLYAGMGTQSHGPIPAGMWGNDPKLTQYSYDLDKARDLLSQAGYPNGGFELRYTYSAGDLDEQQVGELWKAELDKLGIDLTVEGLQWEAQWDLAISDPSAAQNMFAFYWWPDYVTPYSFLFNMFHCEDEPFFNLGYYCNSEFDALIDKGNEVSGVDINEAADLFVEAQEMLVEDAAAIFIIDLPDVHVIRSDITGYVDNPAYPHVVFWYNLRRVK
jgi:peptide/nickel transport system substrate-binding protein